MFAGHAVLFVGPAAKIYQLAAFGTERAMWVVFPLDGLTAGRTLHKAKLKMQKAKVKVYESKLQTSFSVEVVSALPSHF